MNTADLRKLKSGTDIRGVASEGVKGEPITLTDEAVEKIAAGFVEFLAEKTGKKTEELLISVGHDSRISAARVKKAITGVLIRYGMKVLDLGLCSTPAMFMSTVDLGCDGAVQITASHHPFNRNGLKFFLKAGGISSGDLDKILELAEKSAVSKLSGEAVSMDYMSTYAERLRRMIITGTNGGERPLAGFKIAVDAGNGAGGFYARDVLEPLGADISGSQFLEPDGMFPNHVPNPEDPTAMSFISAAVLREKADLGVIFDTDVDRAACVDETGREINRNRLIALASAIALAEEPGGTIVTDSVTSGGLAEYIRAKGGRHHRFKRGYRNVIDEAARLNKEGIPSPLAIETSGHAAFRENHFLDDGAYLMTRVIIEMARLRRDGRALGDLIGELKEPAEENELRFKILSGDFKAYGTKIINGLANYAEEQKWSVAPDNHEGIRVLFPGKGIDGWFLLRLSVHDPIMPLNIESDTTGGNRKIALQLYSKLKEYELLDTSPLRKLLKI